MGAVDMYRELSIGTPCWLIHLKMENIVPSKVTPNELSPHLTEFQDVFPNDLPDHLPPMHVIQHAIDFPWS